MIALLRLQAILLVRTATWGMALTWALYAGALVALVALTARSPGTLGSEPFVLLLGVPLTICIVGPASDALRMARGVVPLSRAKCAVAQIVVWVAVGAGVALLVGVTCIACGAPAAEPAAAANALSLAAAALVPVVRVWRTGRRVAMWALPLASVAVPILIALVAADAVASPVALAAFAAASVALGVVSIVRMESAPASSGGATHGRTEATATPGVAEVVAGPSAPRGRTPAWTLLRSMSSTTPPLLWCVLGLGVAAIPGRVDTMPFFLGFTCVGGLAMCGLTGMRWVLATPVDRGWAFRVLVGPAFALAVAIGAVRFGTLEVVGDRTVFFSPGPGRARETHRYPAHPTLHLGDLLEVRGKRYEPPDPALMATRLSAYFRQEYELDVPAERIEATIRHGWPGRPDPRDPGFARQEATFDAMDRVHEDLASELRSADRRRTLVNVVAGVVLLCGVVRTNLCRRRLTKVLLTILLWLPLLAMIAFAEIFSMKSPASAEPGTVLELLTSLQRLVLDGSPSRLVAYVAAAAAAVWALWRSSGRAFRRLDLTELPPVAGRVGR